MKGALYHNHNHQPLSVAVPEFARRYEQKYGQAPVLVAVNPVHLDGVAEAVIGGVQVITKPFVLRWHLFCVAVPDE